MPTPEEEQRRRCIIDPNQCTTGLTQEAALAETLASYDGDEGSGRDYYRLAKGLLRDFTFAARRLLPLALAACLLAGCASSPLGSFSRALFTRASFADMELRGVARGCVPIIGALATSTSADPRVAAAGQLLSLLGQDPLGCVLQVEKIGGLGETWYALCDGKLAATCAAIPGNQPVMVSGQPIGPGGILRATRVARND